MDVVNMNIRPIYHNQYLSCGRESVRKIILFVNDNFRFRSVDWKKTLQRRKIEVVDSNYWQ